jgi:hypothetical protein
MSPEQNLTLHTLEIYRCDDTPRLMPPYEISFRCIECQREHPIHIRIHLDYGPSRKETLAEFLAGRPTPPQLAAVRGHNALCLKTGRTVRLENDDWIFLVPSTSVSLPLRHLPFGSEDD